MVELLELVASLMKAVSHGKQYRDDLRGTGSRRLIVIALLLLVTLCAGIGCLMLYLV